MTLPHKKSTSSTVMSNWSKATPDEAYSILPPARLRPNISWEFLFTEFSKNFIGCLKTLQIPLLYVTEEEEGRKKGEAEGWMEEAGVTSVTGIHLKKFEGVCHLENTENPEVFIEISNRKKKKLNASRVGFSIRMSSETELREMEKWMLPKTPDEGPMDVSRMIAYSRRLYLFCFLYSVQNLLPPGVQEVV